MKKKIIILISVFAMLVTFSAGSANASAIKLSPGLDVIAHRLELNKTALAGDKVKFSVTDFEEALGTKELSSITVLTLPDKNCGVLKLLGIPVMKNQIISAKNIENLTFEPTSFEECQTSFVIGSVSSSQPLAIKCKISLTASLNFAPEADSDSVQTITTMESVAVYSYMSAKDPENGKLSYKIVTYPEKGTIKVIDRESGYFRYKALGSYVGSDSFEFVALDEQGNSSKPFKVSIEIRQKGSDLVYCDMEDSPALYDALTLAEKGIMVGNTVASKTYFKPAENISKQEFLAMAMSAAGIKVKEYKDKSYSFSDYEDVDIHLSDYVYKADKEGYVSAITESCGGQFKGSDDITTAEAALMIYNILGIKVKGDVQALSDMGTIPAWAEDSVAAVAAVGIIEMENYKGAMSLLTRADAAVMLCNMLEYSEK